MVGETLRNYLMIAWLLPLAGFVVEIFFGFYSKNPRHSKAAAWCAVGCIGAGFLCSCAALVTWGNANDWCTLEHHDSHGEHADAGHETAGHEHGEHAAGDHHVAEPAHNAAAAGEDHGHEHAVAAASGDAADHDDSLYLTRMSMMMTRMRMRLMIMMRLIMMILMILIMMMVMMMSKTNKQKQKHLKKCVAA